MKGELEKRCYDYQPSLCVHAPEEDERGNITQKVHKTRRPARREEIKQAIDEARKDFALSEDDLFDLEEYGLEDDAKLTKGAIELKVEILQKVAKKYLRANKKWFGEK